jgi:molecular chaperone DnaK (HSP70)
VTTDGHRPAIDFGTSSTVAMVTGRGGGARPLLFDASPLPPSAVFAARATGLLTGVDAERAAVASPAAFEANPKRCVGDGTVWLGEREVPVVDLVAEVLHIHRRLSLYLGDGVRPGRPRRRRRRRGRMIRHGAADFTSF